MHFIAGAVACLLAVAPAPPELLTTTPVGKKGAVEICLSGTKARGATLLFRVEVWRGKSLLGATEVPDQDGRALYAQCRTIPRAAVGDLVKVFSTRSRPRTVTVTLRPGTDA